MKRNGAKESELKLGHTEMVSYTIRDARLADHEELEALFRRASLSNENDRELLLQHPDQLALPIRGIREGRVRLAADEANVLVGFATFLVTDGVAELEDLFVDPGHRRRGIAELLVLDISKRVREMGFDTLEVTANPHAMAFYEYMGFDACGLVETEFYPASRMKRKTS
jgi:GNAT superfamily N-acetyltransferase